MSMNTNPIEKIIKSRTVAREKGIYSCCSANEYVIRAALRRAKAADTVVLVEATANQVNQNGGYTGMTPADFKSFLDRLAKKENFPSEKILCGGDHLGPLTWQNLPEQEAMKRAEELIREYVSAGFVKIHIDTTMRLDDDDKTTMLSDETIARRSAVLCKAAEEAYAIYAVNHPDAPPPVYVVGSEVPVPGGAVENEDSVQITALDDCRRSMQAFEREFKANGLEDALARIIAIVVQPGVEFADESVVTYNSALAKGLLAYLEVDNKGVVFEGHSTDYQPRECLRNMVKDGIAILKVGPALTFSMREGLFALEQIERELYSYNDLILSEFRATLEKEMLKNDIYWAKYYHGDLSRERYARAYSLSDRARYYLSADAVRESIEHLLINLDKAGIPMSLLSQYMPVQYQRVHSGRLAVCAEDLLIDHIGDVIDDYLYAILQDYEN